MLILDGYEGLSTRFYVEVFDDGIDIEKIRSISKILTDEIDRFGVTYSRFRKDSLLMKLNREKHVTYDKDLASMLAGGLQMENATNGIFSLFIQNKLEEKGYGALGGVVTKEKNMVTISEEGITLTGGLLDLGGIGKGYLVDKLAFLLKEQLGCEYFLINAGGDMYATSEHGEPITVFMEHPKHKDRVIGEIKLLNQAFCSSSSYVRSWKKDGEAKNHFITQDGSEVWAASYVVGKKATVVDMMATVFCIIAKNHTDITKYEESMHVSALVYEELSGEWTGSLVFNSLLS